MKKYLIELTEDEFELLFTGLRYLELHHPETGVYDLKPEFRQLLTTLYSSTFQTNIFKFQESSQKSEDSSKESPTSQAVG